MQFKNKNSCSKSTTARPKPGIFIANILTKVTVQKAIFSMWTRVGVQQRNFAYFKYLHHRHEKFWSQIKFPFLYFFKIRIPTWKTGSASDFTHSGNKFPSCWAAYNTKPCVRCACSRYRESKEYQANENSARPSVLWPGVINVGEYFPTERQGVGAVAVKYQPPYWMPK